MAVKLFRSIFLLAIALHSGVASPYVDCNVVMNQSQYTWGLEREPNLYVAPAIADSTTAQYSWCTNVGDITPSRTKQIHYSQHNCWFRVGPTKVFVGLDSGSHYGKVWTYCGFPIFKN